MGANRLLIGLTLSVLFAFVIVNYSFGFATDNSAVIDLSSDYELSQLDTDLESNITNFKLDTQSKSDAFYNSSISSGDETTVSGGQFKGLFSSLKTSMSLITGTVNKKIFGGDASFGVITTIFSALLVVFIFLSIWKVWKGGNPD
jgi:hypothetical protein|tara:strand:- start:817 stop:1251 length:435 start_codon:yes stop_codon:yes gene_type:complete